MFEKILKGARSGMPGAGGVKNPKGSSAGSAGSGYFATHSEAMASAHEYIKSKGYEVSDDNWFQHVSGTRKPGEGKTNEYHLPLHKDGKETDKYAHVQVYNRGNNVPKNYELNAYVDSGKPKVSKEEEGFAAVMKGARSGQPGAGGVKHPGMKQKNISTGDWKNVPTEQLRAAIGAFAPHAASSDQNKEIAAAMVKELGYRGKDHPDADLVNVGDSWNGGDGQPEKTHAIPKPSSLSAGASRADARAQLEGSRREKLKEKLKSGASLSDGEAKAAGFRSAADAAKKLTAKKSVGWAQDLGLV